MKVVDVSNPDAPRVVRHAVLPANPQNLDYGPAVAVGGGLVVVTGPTGTLVFRAECSPTTPVVLSDLEATSTPAGVRIGWRVRDNSFSDFLVLRAPASEAASTVFAPRNADAPVPGPGPWAYLDPDVVAGETYAYKILGSLADGSSATLGPVFVQAYLPGLALESAWPNPARGAVTLRYSLARSAFVQLRVFDPAGRLVRRVFSGPSLAGRHLLEWNGMDERGRPAPSGVYFIQLDATSGSTSRRLTLVR